MTLDWDALRDLPPVDVVNALQAEADARMADVGDDDDEDAALARLPGPLRVLWLLSWLEFEVTQGALHAYFFNSHGRHAALAVGALREIGAARMAAVVEQAAAAVSAGAGEWASRREALAEAAGADGFAVVQGPYAGLPSADLPDELTRRFWAAADEDDWGELLEAYVVAAVATEANG